MSERTEMLRVLVEDEALAQKVVLAAVKVANWKIALLPGHAQDMAELRTALFALADFRKAHR